MPKTTTSLDKALRTDFCLKVRPLIGKGKKFATQREAANDVGISPQRLNLYLKSKATPSHHVLAMISVRWGVSFSVYGTELKASQFRARRATTVESQSIQLNLFDKPETVSTESGHASLKVERKGEHVIGFYVEVALVTK